MMGRHSPTGDDGDTTTSTGRWLLHLVRDPARRATLLWAVPIVLVGLVAAGLLGSSLVPYRPFILTAYQVQPGTVCPGAPVRALVTREFTGDATYLRLSESWITVDVEGFPPDRPISTEASELPPAALAPRGVQTVPSPLITEAPNRPGTYRVRIIAEIQGSRFGFMPAIGSTTFASDGTTTVLDPAAPQCQPSPSMP